MAIEELDLEEIEDLDVDQGISLTAQGAETKSTTYFEDVIFKLTNSINSSIEKINEIIQFVNVTRIETSVDYTQQELDDEIFCDGTLEITLLDPSTAPKTITIRNISGTTTITPSAGTTETTSLTVGQSVTLAPRATGWFVI